MEVYTPGVMQAGLISPIFWGGMLLALTAGFLAAWPVNYWLVGKGIRHIHLKLLATARPVAGINLRRSSAVCAA